MLIRCIGHLPYNRTSFCIWAHNLLRIWKWPGSPSTPSPQNYTEKKPVYITYTEYGRSPNSLNVRLRILKYVRKYMDAKSITTRWIIMIHDIRSILLVLVIIRPIILIGPESEMTYMSWQRGCLSIYITNDSFQGPARYIWPSVEYLLFQHFPLRLRSVTHP